MILVEAGPRILPTFPESLAKKAHAELTRLGVEVRTNCAVSSVDERGVVIAGEHLAAKTVVWMAVLPHLFLDWFPQSFYRHVPVGAGLLFV